MLLSLVLKTSPQKIKENQASEHSIHIQSKNDQESNVIMCEDLVFGEVYHAGKCGRKGKKLITKKEGGISYRSYRNRETSRARLEAD